MDDVEQLQGDYKKLLSMFPITITENAPQLCVMCDSTELCRITPDKKVIITVTDVQLEKVESSGDATLSGIATLVREILRLRNKYEKQ